MRWWVDAFGKGAWVSATSASNDGPKGENHERDIEAGPMVEMFEDPTESDIVCNSSGVNDGRPPGYTR